MQLIKKFNWTDFKKYGNQSIIQSVDCKKILKDNTTQLWEVAEQKIYCKTH